jgi:hypothetical protein
MVEAERAADQRGGRHVGEQLPVRLERVPLWVLGKERHGLDEYRSDVPRRLRRLKDLTEQLPAESL